MNPYQFVLDDNNLSTNSQGDLGGLYACLKALETGYSSGYGTHTPGNAYRYVVANFPAGEFKKYAQRMFSAKVVLA